MRLKQYKKKKKKHAKITMAFTKSKKNNIIK